MAIHSKIINKVLASSQRGEESSHTGHSVPGYSDTGNLRLRPQVTQSTAFQAEHSGVPVNPETASPVTQSAAFQAEQECISNYQSYEQKNLSEH